MAIFAMGACATDSPDAARNRSEPAARSTSEKPGAEDAEAIVVKGDRLIVLPDHYFSGLGDEDEPVNYTSQKEYYTAVKATLNLFASESREKMRPVCAAKDETRPAVRDAELRRCRQGGFPVSAIFVAKNGNKVSISLGQPCFLNFTIYELVNGVWSFSKDRREYLLDCDLAVPPPKGDAAARKRDRR